MSPAVPRRYSRIGSDRSNRAVTSGDEKVDPVEDDRRRTDQFVGMYVNNLTLDYGDRGRTAVRKLLGDAQDAGLLPSCVTVEFAS